MYYCSVTSTVLRYASCPACTNCTGYTYHNQVLINASFYAENLPRALAGVVYFDDVDMADKIQATRIYVQMLDHFPHMDERNIPLLQINRMALLSKGRKDPRYSSGDPRSADQISPGEESMVIIDRSRGARQVG